VKKAIVAEGSAPVADRLEEDTNNASSSGSKIGFGSMATLLANAKKWKEKKEFDERVALAFSRLSTLSDRGDRAYWAMRLGTSPSKGSLDDFAEWWNRSLGGQLG